MRQEYLPIGRGDGGHEDSDKADNGADEEYGTEISSIGETSGKGTDEKEEEDLHGADPGDIGGGAVEGGDVVGLEDAERVYEPPVVVSDWMRGIGNGWGILTMCS